MEYQAVANSLRPDKTPEYKSTHCRTLAVYDEFLLYDDMTSLSFLHHFPEFSQEFQ